MQNILTILNNTPWYVFVLLPYLIILGLLHTKVKSFKLKLFSKIPYIILLISLYLLSKQNVTSTLLIIYLLTLAFGALLGRITVRKDQQQLDSHNKSIRLKGSYIPLMLFLTIFFVKYYLGYYEATHPQYAQSPLFTGLKTAIDSTWTGILIGRTYTQLKKAQKTYPQST